MGLIYNALIKIMGYNFNTKNLRNEFKYANNIEKKIKKNYKK